MVNKCAFIGRLGKQVDMRYSQGGDAIANFSIACTESWKDKQGNKQEKTEWVRCVAFGRLAEICGEYLTSGSQVYCEGSLQTRKYDDKEGVTRYVSEIKLKEMKMLSPRQQSSPDYEGYQEPPSGEQVPF